MNVDGILMTVMKMLNVKTLYSVSHVLVMRVGKVMEKHAKVSFIDAACLSFYHEKRSKLYYELA